MYKTILEPLDGSALAECVLPHVGAIANGCGVHNVVFLSVIEPSRRPDGLDGSIVNLNDDDFKRLNSQKKAAAETYLNQLLSRVKYDGVIVKSEIIAGKAAESIADYAAKNGVELIVISTHGRSGPSRWVWGSVADRVLRSSCVPVLMVRAPGCIPGI
jgi:nucleotide-binding universal stress UspA family protein